MKTKNLQEQLEEKLEDITPISEDELEEKGIMLNDDRSSIKYVNWNLFIEYFLTIYTIIYTDLDRLYVYCDNVYKELTDNTLIRLVRNLLQRLVPNSWKWTYEKIILSTIKLEAVKITEFNKDMDKLNLLNGIWSLKKEKLLKHSSKRYTSIKLPITYNSKAKCPKFKKFLKQIFDNDKERIMLVQEIMGYCLTSYTVAQKAFIFLGTGANGKSILLNIIVKLIGADNVSTLPLSDFESSFRRCMLVDKKLNVVTEGEIRTRSFCTNQFKAIVSGDLTTAEIKGGALFNFQPFCRILVSMNKLHKISDESFGFQRRVIIVIFDKVIKKEEQNKYLQQELETEIDGIFNFALIGLSRLVENDFNFTESKRCNAFMKEYFQYNNPLNSFVEEMIVQGTDTDKKGYK